MSQQPPSKESLVSNSDWQVRILSTDVFACIHLTNDSSTPSHDVDGSRKVRRFKKSDPIRYLYEYARREMPEADLSELQLIFHRQTLEEDSAETVESSGLENASLVVSV